MIRIAVTAEAFEAIAKTLPLGSLGYENKVNERGEREIWLDESVLNKLRFMRGPRESYSDVILLPGKAGSGTVFETSQPARGRNEPPSHFNRELVSRPQGPCASRSR